MILVDFAILIVIAFCASALSRFLDFCFEPGNILHWWYNLAIRIGQAKFDHVGNLISENGLYKPLAGCVVCMNFWISAIPFFWVMEFMSYSYFGFVCLFFGYQGISSFFLWYQQKLLS